MTGIRPLPRRGTRPCGLLLPASQAIGCDHCVGKACLADRLRGQVLDATYRRTRIDRRCPPRRHTCRCQPDRGQHDESPCLFASEHGGTGNLISHHRGKSSGRHEAMKKKIFVGVSALMMPGRPVAGSPCSSRTFARLLAAAIAFHASRLNTRMFTVWNQPARRSVRMWLWGSPLTLVALGPSTRDASIMLG